MTRPLAATLLLVPWLSAWSATPTARAGAPPILEDGDRATRLAPLPDLAEPATLHEREPEPEPEPGAERESSFMSVHTRWVTVPDLLFDQLFDVHPSYDNIAVGLGVELGSIDDAMWVLELDWTPLVPDAGNWLEPGQLAPAATYVESSLQMLSFDVSYRRYFSLTDSLHFIFGGGLGVALLTGDLNMKEVLPTCEGPAADCAHWRHATDEAADLPTRVLPVLHITTGLQLELGDGVMVRISAGFRNVLYAGLTLGVSL